MQEYARVVLTVLNSSFVVDNFTFVVMEKLSLSTSGEDNFAN